MALSPPPSSVKYKAHGYKRTQISAAVIFKPESCGMTKIFLFICEFLSLVAEVTQFRSRINLGLLCTRIARENVCYLSTRIKFSNCAKVNHRTVHLAAQKNPDLFLFWKRRCLGGYPSILFDLSIFASGDRSNFVFPAVKTKHHKNAPGLQLSVTNRAKIGRDYG